MLPSCNVSDAPLADLFSDFDYSPLNIDVAIFCDTLKTSRSMDRRFEQSRSAPQPGDPFKPVGVTASLTDNPRSMLVSRPSSLTEEWFGNSNNTHANDISIDSSLEALFACDYNTDFGLTAVDIDTNEDLPSLKVENVLLAETDTVETSTTCPDQSMLLKESVYANQSFCSTINPADWMVKTDMLTLPPALLAATVSGVELNPMDTVTNVEPPPVSLSMSLASFQPVASPPVASVHRRTQRKRTTSATSGGTARKRHISSESRDSDSDGDSQMSDDSDEDLAKFAEEYLSEVCRSKPYFWQYNAQSRGPKGQRLCDSIELEDSHVVPDFTDPVFGSRWQLAPFQHSGKARHGDGNDPRPDPKKLLSIGCRIWKLETEFRAIGQEPSNDGVDRSAANRQKNKLASRICRLKKKALHAANKIKLDGLKQEHGQLMEVIKSIVSEMEQRITVGEVSTTSADSSGRSLCQILDQLIRQHLSFMIAGHTTDYVNSELEKVATQLVSGKNAP